MQQTYVESTKSGKSHQNKLNSYCHHGRNPFESQIYVVFVYNIHTVDFLFDTYRKLNKNNYSYERRKLRQNRTMTILSL